MGSVFTIIAYSLVLLYVYIKTDVWIKKKDVDIMQSVLDSYYDDSYVFDFE